MQITKIKLVSGSDNIDGSNESSRGSVNDSKESSKGVVNDGCNDSCEVIIKHFEEISINEKMNVIDIERFNIQDIEFDLEDNEESNYLIFRESKEIFEKNFKSYFIGGNHSVTFPIMKAFSKVEDNPLLIVFDAHSDCQSFGDDVNSENWLRRLIDDGYNQRGIVLISCRKMTVEELDYITEKKITMIKPSVIDEDMEGVCDILMERARSSSGFYISVDIDCVDPAFAPGTGNIEPGGLSSRDIIYFVKRLSLLKNFRGGDIVEVDVSKDINEMTSRLAAKILSEMV